MEESTMIVKKEGICGGSARIAGTRIAVWEVVSWHKLGWSEEKIARELCLRPEQVKAALKYYERHKEEIGGEIEQAETLEEELSEKSREAIEKLKAKRRAMRV